MKLTRENLKEMVKQELAEISGTRGGTKQTGDVKSKSAARKSQQATTDDARKKKQEKSRTSDAASSAYDQATDAYDAADKKHTEHVSKEPHKYQWTRKGKLATGSALPKEYDKGSDKLRSEWQKWETERNGRKTELDKALVTRRDAKTTFDTESSSFKSAKKNHESEVKKLDDTKKAEIEAKKQARQGFGGGSRTSGKAGVAVGKARASKGKAKSGKKGKKKKKNESLFNILGRKLIKELKDIKKYS